MARRTLHIKIDCGVHTCASEPGKFCAYMRTTHMGSRWVCGLFGVELRDDKGGQEGWLQRCNDCRKMEAL